MSVTKPRSSPFAWKVVGVSYSPIQTKPSGMTCVPLLVVALGGKMASTHSGTVNCVAGEGASAPRRDLRSMPRRYVSSCRGQREDTGRGRSGVEPCAMPDPGKPGAS